MIGSVILFILFIIVFVTISDIITILFRLTGLTEEKARFQVVSLLTNSGFTTQESEVIVNSKIRRKLAKATMLFGYAFTVTIVSTVVNVFLTLNKEQLHSFVLVLPFIILGIVFFYFFRRNPFIKSKFDHLIENIGNRIMFGKNSNPVVLLDDYGHMVVAQIFIHKVPHILNEVPLSQSGLKENYNILVMMIKGANGQAKPSNGDTIIHPKDIIIVLGTKQQIKHIFEKV